MSRPDGRSAFLGLISLAKLVPTLAVPVVALAMLVQAILGRSTFMPGLAGSADIPKRRHDRRRHGVCISPCIWRPMTNLPPSSRAHCAPSPDRLAFRGSRSSCLLHPATAGHPRTHAMKD
ncbi:hypothetical protein [Marinibacterium profundimaris]|uniref:hypothetical protein n=1 Tax=Marinibacterium profundimaris TaxID=1679460 RepID=UPI00117F996E|nr:hypothetical protein [Marinibacterium profundimaris]